MRRGRYLGCDAVARERCLVVIGLRNLARARFLPPSSPPAATAKNARIYPSPFRSHAAGRNLEQVGWAHSRRVRRRVFGVKD